uniref:Uncharacterized protein n=1 Tax=Arundo donax TaxID=35708 RepID=A0A0A9EFP8_ARUDO
MPCHDCVLTFSRLVWTCWFWQMYRPCVTLLWPKKLGIQVLYCLW